jgi:hypothetical protein
MPEHPKQAPDFFFALQSITRRSDSSCFICLDTGCTVSSTFALADFEAPSVSGDFGSMRTIHGVIPITGFGIVCWEVRDESGDSTILRVPAYYIPPSDQRLLSPQQYGSYHGWTGYQ